METFDGLKVKKGFNTVCIVIILDASCITARWPSFNDTIIKLVADNILM